MDTQTLSERELILANLASFIKQRPGMDPRNYISSWNDTEGRRAYRSEVRSVTRDLHQARALLSYVGWHASITADDLKAALKSAYSGRLIWDGRKLNYCTGQYFPTEYRRAVCAVLASAIWDYLRANMPKGELVHNSETGETFERYNGLRAGDYLRKAARRELGATLAKRWFN